MMGMSIVKDVRVCGVVCCECGAVGVRGDAGDALAPFAMVKVVCLSLSVCKWVDVEGRRGW